ncbi:MAG: beta-lactamase family protein [Myxococcales bacterium]|nr:beta-lactamase family protein [Myxococcales bacterium]
MLDQKFLAGTPEEVGLDAEKVGALLARAERDVADGLLPATQVAIARDGKVGAMRTFGSARDDTCFVAMSATKALTSAASWILLQEGKLRLSDRVVDFIPEYGTNGKETTTVEHLLTHTSGIPFAPHWQKEWADPAKRSERFSRWRAEHPPGEKFRYHLSANFWPIAAMIEKISGQTLRDFVHTRIAEPLGIPGLRLGLPLEGGDGNVADLAWVGEPLTPEDYEKMGIKGNPVIAAIDEKGVLELNKAEARDAGAPSAGLITTAADLALFYQALLTGRAPDGTEIWRPEMLEDAKTIRNEDLRDPVLGHRANRALGIVVAGDDGKANMRGFGRTNSAAAFGHPGFGGQCGWADPETGISFAFLTSGFDRNEIRMGRRQVALSSLAASCAA